MKAVIFAAGKGTRLHPLTKDKPKPMVHVCGLPILEYTLKTLPDCIDTVIIVTGYLGEHITSYFGYEYAGKKIHYAVQNELLGTFHALKTAEPLLDNETFLCLVGDDFYKKEDLAQLSTHKHGVLVKEVGDLSRFDNCIIDDDKNLIDFVGQESGHKQTHQNIEDKKYIFTGACVLNNEIFDEEVVYTQKGEWSLPGVVLKLGKRKPVRAVEATSWYSVTSPEDIPRIELILKSSEKTGGENLH